MDGTEMYDKLRGQWYDQRELVSWTLGHSHVLPPELRSAESAWNVLNRLTQKSDNAAAQTGFLRNWDARFCEEQAYWRHEIWPTALLHVLRNARHVVFSARIDQALNPACRAGADLATRGSGHDIFFGLMPAAQHTPTLFEASEPAPTQRWTMRPRGLLLHGFRILRRSACL